MRKVLALAVLLPSLSWGATTRFLRSTDSACTGGADFNEQILLASAAAVTLTVLVPGLSTDDSFGFTEALDPNDNAWDTGDWTVEVNVTNANANMDGAVALARVNSACVQQEITSFTAFQSLTAGVKTFTLNGIGWASGNYGDRIKVVYRFRNNLVIATSFDFEENTANAEITGPLPQLGTHTATSTVTPTATHTSTPTMTSTPTPSSTPTATPTITPDGTRVVYSRLVNGNFDIYVSNHNGSAPVRLTSNPGADTQPRFSPGGARIFFVSDRTGSKEIWVMNSDGTGQTQVTKNAFQDQDVDVR